MTNYSNWYIYNENNIDVFLLSFILYRVFYTFYFCTSRSIYIPNAICKECAQKVNRLCKEQRKQNINIARNNTINTNLMQAQSLDNEREKSKSCLVIFERATHANTLLHTFTHFYMLLCDSVNTLLCIFICLCVTLCAITVLVDFSVVKFDFFWAHRVFC